jgi:hypothetical protein
MRLVTAVNKTAASDLKIERDEFASILMKIGLKRNVAKVLTSRLVRISGNQR